MADDALRGDLANATDPTKGAALVGYTAPGVNAIPNTTRRKLDYQPIDARDYGLSPSASPNTNRLAIVRALTAANGTKVIVDTEGGDFEAGLATLNDIYDIDLEFRGSGRWVVSNSGALYVNNKWEGIQPVSAITDGTAVVNGITEALTKILIEDTTEYKIGDRVRIVSKRRHRP